ncbi:hypothetical protein ACP70R_011421 [Stipagrostis hirtigluma subsp. patula]
MNTGASKRSVRRKLRTFCRLLHAVKFLTAARVALRRCAMKWGVPFLGKVPMDPQLCKAAEEGRSCFTDQNCSGSAPALKQIIKKFIKTQ